MNDGKLDLDEINAAFAAVDVNSKTAADLKVEAKQNGQDIVIKADGSTAVAPAVNGIPPLAVAATGEVPIPAHADTDPDYN
jgi:ABC-type phosphate transport system substrate-binding protein